MIIIISICVQFFSQFITRYFTEYPVVVILNTRQCIILMDKKPVRLSKCFSYLDEKTKIKTFLSQTLCAHDRLWPAPKRVITHPTPRKQSYRPLNSVITTCLICVRIRVYYCIVRMSSFFLRVKLTLTFIQKNAW